MTIINGDCGGIIFRGQSEYYQHYYFRVCQDGTFIFSVYKNNDYHQTQTLKGGTTSAINTGSGEPNLIAVVAQGSILDLYVNLQHLARVYNDVNSRGEIAVVAESLTSGSLANCDGIADPFVITHGTNASWQHRLSGRS